jgi:hypothetical protein
MVFKDLTGQKFEQLTVTEQAESCNYHRFWKAVCACGTEKKIREDALQIGHCGNRKCHPRKSANFVDITGKLFGNLTVLRRTGTKHRLPLYLWELSI